MLRKLKTGLSLLLCVCLFCLSLIFTATAESIYQVALLQSLAQGYFDGSITVADLRSTATQVSVPLTASTVR